MNDQCVHRVSSALLGVLLTAVVAAGCGADGGGGSRPATIEAPSTEATPGPSGRSSSPSSATTASASPSDAAHGAAGAWRAVPVVPELSVLDTPGGEEIATLGERTAFGTPTVVGVIGADTEPGAETAMPGWIEVLVPERPNDLTGWVRAGDVEVEALDTEIHIDIADRTLRLFEGGEETARWTVAVGRADRPTPTGRFFITDKLATGDPGGVYGPWAFGVSAFSDVLTDFLGGDGQIGLHGTNDPSSLGNAASSGCIRLPNEVMADLIERLPLGTPVEIV